MAGYPEGLHADDFCYMEGHIYPDATSADPVARGHVGEPPSKCVRCGEVNYALRGYIASRARAAKKAGITVEEWDDRQEALAMVELDRLDAAEKQAGGS